MYAVRIPFQIWYSDRAEKSNSNKWTKRNNNMNKLYTKAYHNHVQGIEIIVQTVIGWCVMCTVYCIHGTKWAQLQSEIDR